MKTVTVTLADRPAEEIHRDFAEALAFPPYYGNNLDALYDALTDICEDTELCLLETETAEAARFLRVAKNAERENPFLTVTTE